MKSHFYHSAILEICTKHHLTVDEIFDEVRARFPKAGFSTIYRNVEELCERQELRKLTGIGNKALFERCEDNHIAHFVDRDTGEVYDVNIPKEWLFDQLPDGFDPDSADVRFYGRVSSR